MKYKIITEKLDWTGEIIRTVSEYEDEFNVDFSLLFEEFVKTGKLSLHKLPKPFISLRDIMRKVIPRKSTHTFDDCAPGISVIAGEYYSDLGLQFVCIAPGVDKTMTWVETNTDVTEA